MPTTKSLKFIIIIFFILLLTETFSFSQEDNLVIKGGVETQTLTLQGGEAFPITPLKGMLYYKSDENKFYTFDGDNWKKVGGGGGGGSLAVATRIVAASNSLDKTRADYVCDGVNDQEEIQKAINDLPTYGGSVYLLEGTYNISSPININKSNVTLMGAGAATVLNLTTDKAIQASDVSRIVLSQLRIKYNGYYGCWFKNISYSLLEKLWLEGCNINIVKSNFNTIAENFFAPPDRSVTVPPLWLYDDNWGTNGSSYNIILNNIFTTANAWGAIGIFFGSSNNIAIGNIIKGDSESDRGIWIFYHSSRNIIVGNRILNVMGGIVSNYYSTDNILSSNTISQLVGSSSFGMDIFDNAHRQLISSNFISDASTDGIKLSVANSLLVGNILYNNQGGGIDVEDPWYGNADNNLISSNYIYASSGSGYGISISSGSDNNYLVGNFIGDGYSGRLIDDNGNSTKYTDKLKMTLEEQTVDISTSSYNLDPATNPGSYFKLNPSQDVTLTLSDGKSAGDLLILENVSSHKVTINDSGNVNLGGVRELSQNDTLKLIWNGSKWLELRYVDN